MLVKKAEPQHIDGIVTLLMQIAALHRRHRPDLFKPNVAKYSRTALAALIQDERHAVFVALQDVNGTENVVGYCICRIDVKEGHPVMTDRKTLFIDDFCVGAARRKQGIGTQLFETAEAYARKIGAHNIELNVWAFNGDALHFYRGKGFEVQKFGMEKLL